TCKQPYRIGFGREQILIVITTADLIPVAREGRYDIVTVDQEQGGYLAGRKVAAADVTGVCFIGVAPDSAGGAFDKVSLARLGGFERGLEQAIPDARCIRCAAYDPGPAAGAVRTYLDLLRCGEFGGRPGVFAASDDLAMGFVFGAASHGLHAGRDYQLVGFD